MEKLRYRRIAPDSSVINWKAGQGRQPIVQKDPEKRREYQAIEKLFELQDQGKIVLVAVDQVDKEITRTNDEAKREKLIKTLALCKEKHYLWRFDSSTKSKRALKAKGKVGINLGNGAFFETESDERKIEEYTTFSAALKKQVDLEILATAAIAGVKVVVFMDSPFLGDKEIKDFAKQNDDIEICTPTQIIELLSQDNFGLPQSTTMELNPGIFRRWGYG